MFTLFSFAVSYDICLDIGSYYSKSSTFNAGEPPKIGMNYQSKRLTPSFLAFRINSSLYNSTDDKITKKLIKSIKLEFGDDALALISTKPKLGSGFLMKYVDRNISVSSEIAKELCSQSSIFQLSSHSLLTLYIKLYLDCISNNKAVRKVHVVFPASFTLPQRDAVKSSISMSGYSFGESCDDADALIHPYAVAKCSRNQPAKRVLFVDVGATSVKAFVASFTSEGGPVKARRFEYAINERAGGWYLTVAIAEEIIKNIKNPTEVDRQHALEVAEHIKKQLTLLESIEHSFETENGEQVNFKLTRSDLEEIGFGLKGQLEEVLMSAMDGKPIDEVEVVGGSSRIPFIQDVIKDVTNLKLSHSLNADEALAIGGAYAAQLAKEINTYELPKITAEHSHYSLKIRTQDGDMPFCNRHEKCQSILSFPSYAAGFIFSYFEKELPEGLETHEYTYIVTHPEGNNISVILSLAPPGVVGSISCSPEECRNGTIKYVPRLYNNSKVVGAFAKQMSEHNKKAELSNKLESLAIELDNQIENNETFMQFVHPSIREVLNQTVIDTKKWLFENTKIENSTELKTMYTNLKNLSDNVHGWMKRYKRIGMALHRLKESYERIELARKNLTEVPPLRAAFETFDKYLYEVRAYMDHTNVLYMFLPKYNNQQIVLEDLERVDSELNSEFKTLCAKSAQELKERMKQQEQQNTNQEPQTQTQSEQNEQKDQNVNQEQNNQQEQNDQKIQQDAQKDQKVRKERVDDQGELDL